MLCVCVCVYLCDCLCVILQVHWVQDLQGTGGRRERKAHQGCPYLVPQGEMVSLEPLASQDPQEYQAMVGTACQEYLGSREIRDILVEPDSKVCTQHYSGYKLYSILSVHMHYTLCTVHSMLSEYTV